jgi:hypothetical protein
VVIVEVDDAFDGVDLLRLMDALEGVEEEVVSLLFFAEDEHDMFREAPLLKVASTAPVSNLSNAKSTLYPLPRKAADI